MNGTVQSKPINEANRMLKKGKTSKAIEVLENALLKEPQNGELHLSLGVLYQNIGQYDNAERAYRSAESLCPENPSLQWKLGEFLLGLNRAEEAIPYLRYSTKEWPSNAQTHTLYGRACLELKRLKDAEASLNKALEIDDANPDTRDVMIELYKETEREGLVKGLLKSYLADSPKLASSHVFMADYLYLEEGDCKGALPFYEKGLMLAYDKRMASWYIEFFSTNGYPQSIAYSYSNALMDCGYYDLANKVVKENLSGANLLMWNAYIESKAKNLNGAIQLMKKAVAEEPLRLAWKFVLGWYYLQNRQLQLADSEFREALQLPGGNFTDTSDLAEMYILLSEQKKLDESERLKERALERDGAYFWLSLAAHYTELENWEKALEASQQALEAKPIFKEVLIYKARALAKLEKLSEGIQVYRELIGLQPRNGKAYLELSEAFAKVGELEKAISTLDIALSDSILSEPQQEFANQIRENLLYSNK